MNAEKKRARQEAQILEAHSYPPLGSPADLTLYGQQMWPLISIAAPKLNADATPIIPIGVPSPKVNGDATPSPSKHPSFQTTVAKPKPVARTLSLKPSSPSPVKHSHDDFNTSSDEEQGAKLDAHCSESEDDKTSSSSGSQSDHVPKSKKNPPKPKMKRISKDERQSVCDWIAKLRKDGKMNNSRWIRNGGAKGQTMTATSAEVKTLGAFDSLAGYVNRRLRLVAPLCWTRDISKKRWIALCVITTIYSI